MSKAPAQPKSYKKKTRPLDEAEVVNIMCDMHTATRAIEAASRCGTPTGFWTRTDRLAYYRSRIYQYAKRYVAAAEAFGANMVRKDDAW